MEALRERFGKYHVLRKLAQGGMAEVYKVKSVGIAGFEKVQALKRILPGSAHEARFIRSFIDEARIAVELTHRNIVQVFDFGKADGELFMAMELIEGRDLRTAMTQATSRDYPAPVPIAAHIIGEVASGLDYAHRKADGYGTPLGIVHCDMSPSNVMLSTDGYVKILDFGIARATFSSALERKRLRGKPRYMSPEQTLGEPATAQSDVFALGIIAWELFVGRPLFRGTDVKAILESVRRTVPPRLDRLNPDVPAEIVEAVARALSREPAERGTAADLGNAMARSAMVAGARHVATWLRDLDALAAESSSAWEAVSAVVPGAAPGTRDAEPASGDDEADDDESSPPPAAPAEPPLRPSTRSITGSILNMAPFLPVATVVPELGEGTNAFSAEPPTRSSAPSFFYEPAGAPRGQTEPLTSRYERLPANAPGSSSPFLDREKTASVTAVASQNWGPESTTAGVAKLQDAFEAFESRGSTVVDPPHHVSIQRSYEAFVPHAGTRASSLRFDDDEATQFAAAPTAVEAQSFEELEADAAVVASEGVVGPDAIDDDLGALVGGSLAERRRTVVVVGVLEGLDEADDLRAIVRSLGELAYQRGGVVLATTDSSLVVAFGLEIAGEDDVAIAMGWALDASAIVGDAGSAGQTPTLRVGARTGVATTIEADGANRIPQSAIDDARTLARDAAPDRPLFIGTAGRLTSGLYVLRKLPPSKRVRRGEVIEVAGRRAFGELERGRAEQKGTFVGRAAQLAALSRAFEEAVAHDRRVTALVSGATGTGKSRLVAEILARSAAAAPGVRTIICTANPANRNAPFSLVIDFYQAALGMPPARGRAARGEVVRRFCRVLEERGTPGEHVRALASDLDRAMEVRDGVGVAAPEVADLRPRISAGVSTFRAALRDPQRPLLSVIEDIHAADGASLDVLRHSLGGAASGGELTILTARPEGHPPPPVDVTIELPELEGHELKDLVTDRLGPDATPLNVAAVIARGGGNPLFIEELARAVREAQGELPATARDVVAARVDRLSTRAKVALRFAAVLGGTMRRAILEELAGGDEDDPSAAVSITGGHPVVPAAPAAPAAIDELLAAGFLVEPETRAAHPGDAPLQVARGLIREVIYDSLSGRARRESHARVGRLLASRFFAGREEPPAVIAEHMERGGELAAAAAFWLRAGRLAIAAFDATAAVAHFTRTLALEDELGAQPPTQTSRARRREAYAGREEAHRMLGDLASDAGDLDALAALCAGDTRRLADVDVRRAQRLLRLGDVAGATAATVTAEDLAIASGDARLRGEALRVRGEILERLGRFDEALVVVGDAVDLFAREGAGDDEITAMVGRGRILLMRAHYEAAREAYVPVLERIEQTGDPYLERIVQNHVAVIELCLGNFGRAMLASERSLELCRRYGDRAREGDALSVAGIVLLEVGRYDEAAARFTAALDLLARTGSRWSRADCLIYAGVCELRRGQGTGHAMLEEALAEARRLGAVYLEASALVARAGARLRLGDLGGAIEDAAAGTLVARAASLVGYETQGLARHAAALVRRPSSMQQAEAVALVDRALALLGRQRYLEGSEEEVYAYCVEVLEAAGQRERASVVRARGASDVSRKLAQLTDPAWRAAYAALPEVAALL